MISQKEQQELNDELVDASRNGRLEEVKELIKKGAEVDARTLGNQTSLHLAAFKGHVEVVKYLIEKGADVDARTDARTVGYLTPLHWAALYGHLEVVKILCESGADVDVRDNCMDYFTPFYAASREGHMEVVKYLFLERNVLMPIFGLFRYSNLMKEKVGRKTRAQNVFDYFLQNKSKYKTKEIQAFKEEFLEFNMNEEDSKNLKPIIKFF